jgi:hypothetical protein
MVCVAYTQRAQEIVAVVTEEGTLSPALLLVSTNIFPGAKPFMTMLNGFVSMKIQTS